MNNTTAVLSHPESKPAKGILFRMWQAFWLATLVLSLAYAWYCFYVPGNGIAWADEFPSGQQQSVQSGKPMVLFFTGEWCVPCRIMKRTVWADDEVESIVNASFTPVLIDMGKPGDSAEAIERYRAHITPTTIITDAEGNVIEEVRGAMSKSEFLALLKKPDVSRLVQ
ncbi:thioredoxin family protein [Mariniblastus fucicola]|uniref:Thiol:disulfide interchange protein n=1 Tax=Mariniblastus fucicola TaxID=980251 RepID=A0A5B9P728_9BACT|nr:thioredoxin family protein [Mariniblastus fucicola]QEG20740.1 thiol:disulfide interchange protein precursor [Mariniblastus fucicola]